MGIFTYVARDPTTNKAMVVPDLIIENERQQSLFDEGSNRSMLRKQIRGRGQTEESNELAAEVESIQARLWEQGTVLKRLPALKVDGKYAVLSSQTTLHNSLTCQPQNTNMAGRIFGGFLMRRAFEIAFSCAHLAGGSAPRFNEIDSISFKAPVDVGDLLQLSAMVMYTREIDDIVAEEERHGADKAGIDAVKRLGPEICLRVGARVTNPEKRSSIVSNVFYFTFNVPDCDNIAKVLPDDLQTAKRAARRIVDDRLQRQEDRARDPGAYLCFSKINASA